MNPSSLIRSEMWFPDGNIILIAGQFAFKVHRGQLQRHSEVFQDLFSLPQPQPSEYDVVDGCAYVELQDRASDVFYFITALYDGLYFTPPSSADIHALSAVLRLSTKYLVPHLRHLCLSRLQSDFPSSLHAWDFRELSATLPDTGYYKPRDIYPHPILAIQLAFELGLGEILPAALYDLARYGPSRVMTGTIVPLEFDQIEYEEGELGGVKKTSSSSSSGHVVILTRAQLIQTLRGRERVQRYMANFIAESMQNRAASPSCFFLQSKPKQNHHSASSSTTLQDTYVHAQTQTQSVSTTTTNNAPLLLSPIQLSPLTFSPPSPCLTTFHVITHNILRSISGVAYGRDADTLYTLLQALDMLERAGAGAGAGGEMDDGAEGVDLGGIDGLTRMRMCVECKKEFGGCVRRAREEVWMALPGWFGIGQQEQEQEELGEELEDVIVEVV